MRATRFEHIYWRALLLDPRVVAEVEDAVAIAFVAVDHVVGGDRAKMLSKHFGSVGGGELTLEALGQCLASFAWIQVGAVGGNGDECIVGAVATQLGNLDGCNHVADCRETKMLEHLQDVLRYTFAFMQIAQTFVGVEQHVEFVSSAIRNVDDQIGIHHVVDERNVFVADALDVVLAITVLEHGRALQRFDSTNCGAEQILQAIARGDCAR